jgi:hypothetical protein
MLFQMEVEEAEGADGSQLSEEIDKYAGCGVVGAKAELAWVL